MSGMSGKWPAIIREWDRERRECRVEIPGLTDGAEILPLAQIAYSIGDKSEHTEIFIEIGDRVWVEFERGDPRYPIITHWRTKQTGNEQLWRRFHHENLSREAFEGDIHDEATQDINTEAGRDKITQVGRNEQRTIAENLTLVVGANFALSADEKADITAGTTSKIEAATSITLKVGGTTVVITAAGISMSGGGATMSMDASGISLNGSAINLN